MRNVGCQIETRRRLARANEKEQRHVSKRIPVVNPGDNIGHSNDGTRQRLSDGTEIRTVAVEADGHRAAEICSNGWRDRPVRWAGHQRRLGEKQVADPSVHGATELTLAGGRARHQLRGGGGPARWHEPRDGRRRENTSLSRAHALNERLEIVVGRNRHAFLVRRGETTGGGLARRGDAAASRASTPSKPCARPNAV